MGIKTNIFQKTNNDAKKFAGFTIVELLVVIVVISILASITTVAYSGIQTTAKDATIASDLRNFATKAQIFKVDNNSYPAANIPSLSVLGYSVTQGSYPSHLDWNFDYCPSEDLSEYVITAYLNNGEIMYVSSNNLAPVSYDVRDIFTPGAVGNVSPCYSGTPHSAADRAGVGQIGVMDGEGKIVDNAGISGKSSTGWRLWTTGGSS